MNSQSLNAHIGSLEEKHEALKKEIIARESDKLFDDMEMQALKQKKLHLKDEIARCKARLSGA